MKTIDLNEFCKSNLLDEKIFIVPSKSIGMQMINKMARDGYPSINLRAFTINGLAFYICEEYIEKEIDIIIDKILGNNLIFNILKDLSIKYKDRFFFKEELIDSSTAKEVYNAIIELKLGRIDKFPNIKNLNEIYEEYKTQLIKLRAADYCDIINKASELVDEGFFEDKIIGIASNMEVNKTEEEFLNKLRGNFKINTPVKLLEGNRKNYFFKDEFQDPLLGDKNIVFYSSYGTKNEIRYIIDDIKSRRLPLDDVVIAYTNNSYANLINIEFEKEDIPVTFGAGLGVENSSVFRFINTIFSWSKKYYNINEIRPIFANGDIKSIFSAPIIYEELIKRKIIFGRENYTKKLGLDKKIFEDNPNESDLAMIIWIREFFRDLFAAIPVGKATFKSSIPKLINVIHKYVKNINKYDGAATVVVLETLNSLENLNMEVTIDEYFDIVLSYIRSNKILRTQPQPGKVFAINYNNASYTGRKNLYLIGMDSDSLSNKIVESPILLDLMKYKLSNNLNFANESYNYKKNKIRELLTVDFDRISIGYSNFDTVEVKPKSPSQIYNELKGEVIAVKEEDKPVNWTILGRDLVKSGTALEVLAECVRKAYLQYKLGLKEKEDIEIIVDRWLDQLQRGIMVHYLLSQYFDLDKEFQTDEKLLVMVEDICIEARQERESVLEEIYIREKQNIFDICKNMIEATSKDVDWEIFANELSFGLKDDEILAQTVDICGLSIDIKGAIDRVDRNKLNQNVFRIIDYKTGSKNNFDKKLRITIGRGKNQTHDYSQTTKLQYYIYKIALEKILESEISNPVIEKFSYIFDGDTIDIEFDDEFITTIENRITDLLNMDVIKEEALVVYEEEKCKYCIYKNICIVDKLALDVEEVESND